MPLSRVYRKLYFLCAGRLSESRSDSRERVALCTKAVPLKMASPSSGKCISCWVEATLSRGPQRASNQVCRWWCTTSVLARIGLRRESDACLSAERERRASFGELDVKCVFAWRCNFVGVVSPSDWSGTSTWGRFVSTLIEYRLSYRVWCVPTHVTPRSFPSPPCFCSLAKSRFFVLSLRSAGLAESKYSHDVLNYSRRKTCSFVISGSVSFSRGILASCFDSVAGFAGCSSSIFIVNKYTWVYLCSKVQIYLVRISRTMNHLLVCLKIEIVCLFKVTPVEVQLQLTFFSKLMNFSKIMNRTTLLLSYLK